MGTRLDHISDHGLTLGAVVLDAADADLNGINVPIFTISYLSYNLIYEITKRKAGRKARAAEVLAREAEMLAREAAARAAEERRRRLRWMAGGTAGVIFATAGVAVGARSRLP